MKAPAIYLSALILCWAGKMAAGRQMPSVRNSKGSLTRKESVRQRMLSSKSGKGGKSKSEKEESDGDRKSNPSSASSNPFAVASAEEKPPMIIVAPLQSSMESEASAEQGSPTPGPTVNTTLESEPVEDMVVENTVNAIVQPGDYPVQPLENSTETTAAHEPLAGPAMQCPLPDYLPYTIPSQPFVRYPFNHGNTSILLSVTDTCSYIIEDLSGTQDMVYAASPLEWLDKAVYHFGGAPRGRKEQKLTGLAAPSFLDVELMDRGASIFEVAIQAKSAAVEGGKAIAWIFLAEKEAKEFEYFLVSMIRYIPEIFLTGDSSFCGSGPFCSVVGNSICYHDPTNSSLGIIHLNGDEEAYDDSFAWFSDCIEALECSSDSNSTFSYSSCPAFAISGTNFVFTDESGLGTINFQCPTENAVLLVAELVHMLSIDPFHIMAIGGSATPGSHHLNRTLGCMG